MPVLAVSLVSDFVLEALLLEGLISVVLDDLLLRVVSDDGEEELPLVFASGVAEELAGLLEADAPDFAVALADAAGDAVGVAVALGVMLADAVALGAAVAAGLIVAVGAGVIDAAGLAEALVEAPKPV